MKHKMIGCSEECLRLACCDFCMYVHHEFFFDNNGDIVRGGPVVAALKKQIPEKPLRRMFQKYKNWCCPVCQGNIMDGYSYQNAYCRKCGQRIYWNYGWDYVREMCLSVED